MRSLLNPKWLFVINSLPIVLLFILYYGQFNIIKSLLNEESIQLWKSFAIALGVLGIANFGYVIYLTVRHKKVSLLYCIVALVAYIYFIYLYGMQLNEIVPSSIPRWMIPGNLYLYAGTFLMPTLLYALSVLVVHCTPAAANQKAWKNFLAAIAIPTGGYLCTQIMLPLWQIVENNFSAHVIIVLIIASATLFFFFLVRAVYIMISKKSGWLNTYQLIWKIPVVIIFPVVGLLLNGGYFFNETFTISNHGLFGNFNSFWFYTIAIANGVLLCLPNLENKLYRLFLFFSRSITLAYTFYFFIVFLPFLPLSIVAIIVFGAGFLMLTPLVLMMIHAKELANDFVWLKQQYAKPLLWAALLIGFLLIPSIITLNYLNDKNTLHSTLQYLYQPDYSKTYNINKKSLSKTINMVKAHKMGDRNFITGSQLPYLTTYFNWLVLDNLTLSDKKISTIENIFFGNAAVNLTPQAAVEKDDVQITNIEITTKYNAKQNAWRTWIDLEITNNEDRNLMEYVTNFELPEGAWISDYYLYVGDKKEKGILSEKKTAMWIYSNITRARRDPGILHYLTGNRIAFRVYPFAANEVRKTGIEILHKTPIELTIDKKQIQLGEKTLAQHQIFENEKIAFIPADRKKELKQIYRKPYFHFVVDCSLKENVADFIQNIENVKTQHSNLKKNAKISFVNSYVSTHSFNADWKQQLRNQNFGGGFYIDRAIKNILYDAYKNNTTTYPIIIVVTDDIYTAIFDKDFLDWEFTFPEGSTFYNLKEAGILDEHSLIGKPKIAVKEGVDISLNLPVLEYQLANQTIAYLTKNNKPSLISKIYAAANDRASYKLKGWESAAVMQANWANHILHPENKNWLTLVKQSFQTQVMTPVTSYLALENEAQKAMLKKKQKQVLASNPTLDLGDEVQQMSEPGLLLLGLLLLFFLWLKEKRYSLNIKQLFYRN